MQVPVQIVRSDRKTIAIQIQPDGQVLVRCPGRMCLADVEAFVDRKRQWIAKHLAMIKQQEVPRYSPEDIARFREQMRIAVMQRVAYYAPIVGVSYNRITVRAQRTRWGSCSSKGNLNFNCLLVLVPPEVLDYIVVHELCHRKELNHSARFWKEVERVLPDYRVQEKWIRQNGRKLAAGLYGNVSKEE